MEEESLLLFRFSNDKKTNAVKKQGLSVTLDITWSESLYHKDTVLDCSLSLRKEEKHHDDSEKSDDDPCPIEEKEVIVFSQPLYSFRRIDNRSCQHDKEAHSTGGSVRRCCLKSPPCVEYGCRGAGRYYAPSTRDVCRCVIHKKPRDRHNRRTRRCAYRGCPKMITYLIVSSAASQPNGRYCSRHAT